MASFPTGKVTRSSGCDLNSSRWGKSVPPMDRTGRRSSRLSASSSTREFRPVTVKLRELLLPVIDDLPVRDDVPRGFRLVLREIDRFLAIRSLPSKSSITHELTRRGQRGWPAAGWPERRLDRRKRRREAQESLRRSLGLKNLVWIETKEHQAVATFEPMIVRPDVALVLLAIRWSSHAFGDVKVLCDRYGKPLVRLPGGYSPNQVAIQIVSQCSGQLEPK